MQVELRPRPGFEQLVHRADAAGQREERIRRSPIRSLRSDIVRTTCSCDRPGVADFAVEQHLRNHADDAAAGRQRRIGERAHQSDAPAAVDEREAAPRDQLAGTNGERGVSGPVAWAGAAKDTQGSH